MTIETAIVPLEIRQPRFIVNCATNECLACHHSMHIEAKVAYILVECKVPYGKGNIDLSIDLHKRSILLLECIIAVLTGSAMTFVWKFMTLLLSACINTSWNIYELLKAPYSKACLVFILPMMGLVLSQMVHVGIHRTSQAKPSFKLSEIIHPASWTECISHILAGGFAIGYGCSAGLEVPGILTGTAINATLGKIFRLKTGNASTMTACGTAAALTVIFGSPVSGILLATELVLKEYTVAGILPTILAGASAAMTCSMTRTHRLFFINTLSDTARVNLIYVLLCGIICAYTGLAIVKGCGCIEKLYKRIPVFMSPVVICGILLCVILFVFPDLRNTGYFTIQQFLTGDDSGLTEPSSILSIFPSTIFPAIMLLAFIVIKPLISTLTINMTGEGGMLTPSLFSGSALGFTIARIINLTGLTVLPECTFAAFGMCGLFAAVTGCPITGAILIAETTGAYYLIPELLLIAAISRIVVRQENTAH